MKKSRTICPIPEGRSIHFKGPYFHTMGEDRMRDHMNSCIYIFCQFRWPLNRKLLCSHFFFYFKIHKIFASSDISVIYIPLYFYKIYMEIVSCKHTWFNLSLTIVTYVNLLVGLYPCSRTR